MTAKQWRMLEILDHWGGHGTIEVEIQWGDYDFGDTPEGDNKGWRVCRMVVSNMVRSLVKKSYAVNDENGYDITDKGRAVLEKHLKRKGKS
jgi:hypothetical protein